MHSFVQDFRYGFRVLLKTPAFTVVAALTLAVGIGANTAIFSVVNAVLLRLLDMVHPERVMLVQEVWRGVDGYGVSPGNFADLRDQNTVFQSFAASAAAAFNLATPDSPQRVLGENVTASYFPTFSVQPLRGRVFTREEDTPGHQPVAVISERLWNTFFHRDESLVGHTIPINGVPTVVVGIMPGGFDPMLSKSDIWSPIAFSAAQLASHDNHYLRSFARLKPGVLLASARAEMNVIAKREAQLYPIDDKERGFSLTPVTYALLGDQRLTLFTMLGAVGFVLLIACENIANLQLARARGRRQEVAVRVALGATPQRIVRQLLAENLVLAAAGAISGIALAYFGVQWLVTHGPGGVPRLSEAKLDLPTLLFACGIALFASLLFGMAPALRSAAARLTEAFNEGSARTSGSRDRVRSALVVAEVALSLVLLVGAGLLIRSAILVSKIQPGFDARLRVVSPSYLATTHVPLKMGRGFTAQDTRDKTLVVLVNETLARTMWPGENPIDKRFACCEPGPKGRLDPVWHEIVGVVGDVRAWGLDQQVLPEFYMPIAQMSAGAWDWIGRTMDLVLRTKGAPVPVSELQTAVAKVAPGVPIYGVSTMQQEVSSTLEQSHFDTYLLSTFAAAALLLAAVGIYGVLSYTVVQRTREIGIRMALGATQSRVVGDVLQQGIWLIAIGLAIGLAISLGAARLLQSLLFGIHPTDAITFCVVSLLLAAVAIGASYLPARRASRVDPWSHYDTNKWDADTAR